MKKLLIIQAVALLAATTTYAAPEQGDSKKYKVMPKIPIKAYAFSLDDVRGVLRERGGALDIAQIRETLELLEQALGQSDLLPLLDAELQHIG